MPEVPVLEISMIFSTALADLCGDYNLVSFGAVWEAARRASRSSTAWVTTS